jgi:hypothetical protein
LEICDEIEKEFIVVHKKHLMKLGGQLMKQVSKLERVFEHLVLPKLITQE